MGPVLSARKATEELEQVAWVRRMTRVQRVPLKEQRTTIRMQMVATTERRCREMTRMGHLRHGVI